MTLALPAYETPKYGTTKSDVDCAIAQKLFEAKQYETALATVNVVLDDEPDHPWALTLGGRIALMMQKPGLGYNLLKRALAVLPKPTSSATTPRHASAYCAWTKRSACSTSCARSDRTTRRRSPCCACSPFTNAIRKRR
jgi:predicted Zn-dependent protease